jgi:hypothetical protein
MERIFRPVLELTSRGEGNECNEGASLPGSSNRGSDAAGDEDHGP